MTGTTDIASREDSDRAVRLTMSMTATGALTIYTTTWCGYCVRLKTALKASGIAFTEVDIEDDPAAAEFVGKANGGNHTVPTVRFSDGSTLTNPNANEVKRKLAELVS